MQNENRISLDSDCLTGRHNKDYREEISRRGDSTSAVQHLQSTSANLYRELCLLVFFTRHVQCFLWNIQ
jgi:hypothetical protein